MVVRIGYYIQKVMQNQWDSKLLEKTQNKMRREIIKNAYRNNIFYRKKFKENNCNDKTDFQKLPFTTKEELRNNFPDNISQGYSKENCIIESTSGSTGDVLVIYHDKAAYDYYEALSFREYRAFGYKPWQKICYFRFEPLEKRFYDHILRRQYIPVDLNAKKQLEMILKANPDIISGYPSTLLEVAKLVEENMLTLEFIESNSELLTSTARKILQNAFQCPVYDDYSSFEVHNISFECREGGMHLNSDNVVVEILDGNEVVSPGEEGEIVVTSLVNKAMPFIRYRTGDMGVMSDETCPCGRKLPLMKVIEGRKDEFLTLPTGEKVSPRVLDPLDLIFHGTVDKFQIIQEKKGKILIKVVKNKDCKDLDRKLIEKTKQILGSAMDVEVKEVEDIPRTGRGKFRAVISRID